MRALSVKQFNEYIRSSLKHDPIFQNAHIKGEVANFRYSHNHLYFSLKEKEDIIDCVIYYYMDKDIPTNFETGDEIEVYGNLIFNNYSSRLLVNIAKIEEFGISKDYKIFLKLRKDFEKRGYFSDQHKKDIPKLPKKIGLITSGQGAALEDYLNVVNQVPNDIKISFYPVKVQGKTAVYEIVKALDFLDKKQLDLIVITRGGGSKEDLSVFNSPDIVEKVFNLNTPLISAIGHKIDQTLIDLVADLSLQTPTEAASVTVRDYAYLYKDMEDIFLKINKTMKNNLYLSEVKLSFLKKDLYKFDPHKAVDRKIKDLENLGEDLDRKIKEILRSKSTELKMVDLKLESLKKMLDMEKEKIKIFDKDGRDIFSKHLVGDGDYIKIVFADGEIEAEVKDEPDI